MAYARNASDGSRVYFEDDGGVGSPVVFLGGFLDPVHLVRRSPLAQALQTMSEEFRLIFLDHRGLWETWIPRTRLVLWYRFTRWGFWKLKVRRDRRRRRNLGFAARSQSTPLRQRKT